jgi:uncharacterized membrane protein
MTELSMNHGIADTGAERARAAGPPARDRNRSLDELRGLVMVLMVLDHARDFYFGVGRVDPTDLATTTVPLFATRWITHFCAPVFVFLAGTGAYLQGKKRGAAALSRFLFVRGVILVLLEITVVRLLWVPDPFYHFTLLQVIWAIGWSMVLLSAAVRLPFAAVTALGAAIVLGHDLLDGIHGATFGSLGWLYAVLFDRARLEPFPGHSVFVSYAIVPWFGVMALGYAFGRVMTLPPPERRSTTLRIGLACIAAFVLLRFTNVYGDPAPWSAQRSAAFTVLSFLNCKKYPPSLLYTLMTLGPALVVLAWFESRRAASGGEGRRPLRALVVLGGAPLFFYVAHLALLRYTSIVFAYARFGASAFAPPPGRAGSPEFGLFGAYLAWAVAVLLLYPAVRWFLRKKEAAPNGWLRFF